MVYFLGGPKQSRARERREEKRETHFSSAVEARPVRIEEAVSNPAGGSSSGGCG